MITLYINKNKKFLNVNNKIIELSKNIELKLNNRGNIITNDVEIYNNFNLIVDDNKYVMNYSNEENNKLFDVAGSIFNYKVNYEKIIVILKLETELYLEFGLRNFIRQKYKNKELIIIKNQKLYFDETELELIKKISSVKLVDESNYKTDIVGKILVYFNEKTYYNENYIENLYSKIKNNNVIIKNKFEILQNNECQYIRKIENEKVLLESNVDDNEYEIIINNDDYSIRYVEIDEINNFDKIYKININNKIVNSYRKFNEINYYFDKIYIINLERRKDRLKNMKELMNKFNIKVEYIKAFDGLKNREEYIKDVKRNKISEGGYGRLRTLLEIINKIRKNNYNNVLILEDDIMLLKNFNERFNFYMKNSILSEKKWDMLFFGLNYYYKFINKNVFEIKKKLQVHMLLLFQKI